MKSLMGIGLAAVLCGVLASGAGAQNPAPATQPAGGEARKYSFDGPEALAGWTVTGEVAIDAAKNREGKGGSLKVAPGGKAVLKLADKDLSGKVELWVYDDMAKPKEPKVNRVGPRWGVAQTDGNMLVIGILYADYLSGSQGYTGTTSDGQRWFDQLFWLGGRSKAGWNQWTFDFDTEKGLKVLKDGRPVKVDPRLVGLKGFNSLVLLGDSGAKDDAQTIWVADVSAAMGGPVKSVPQLAKKVEGASPWGPSGQTTPIYTKDKPPATPTLEELAEKGSVTQYGITWTFEKPARVGQFVNGDWYVVGPVTVKEISPKPIYGADVPEIELTDVDFTRPVAQRVRNGFMLNPPARQEVSYDSEVKNFFRPELIQKLPVAMKGGDSLVSTVSMPAGLVLPAPLRNKVQRGDGDSSPIRTAAVLTCVEAPQPPDAFRPGFCDRKQTIYLSRNLKRDLLPTVAVTKSVPKIDLYVRFTQRPWVGTCFFGFEEPVENMPQYGLEYGRVAGNAALLLCAGFKPEEKEPLLVNFVQVGIDLGAMIRAGHPGFEGFGGHGSGRKLPIVFAGILLGDEEFANVNKSFPKAHFGEDEQTAHGDCWTGAKVVFTGHRGIDQVTGIARARTGPYEQKRPKDWTGGDKTSESYRRCCTSVGWVAQALTLRLMHAEKNWNHDAFLDYCDRWMFEDETEALKAMEDEAKITEADWAREGQTWEEFVNEMWAQYRKGPGMAPADGWSKPHDDSYLKNAMQKAKETNVP